MSTARGLVPLLAPSGLLATSAAPQAAPVISAGPTAGPGFADLIGAALARLLALPLPEGPLPEVGLEPGPPEVPRRANRHPGGPECREACRLPAPEHRDGLAAVPDAGSAGPNLAALPLPTQASPPALLDSTPAPADALPAEPTTVVPSGTVAARPAAPTAPRPRALGTATAIHEPGGSWAPVDRFDPAAPGRQGAPGGDPEAPPADDRTPVPGMLQGPAIAHAPDDPPPAPVAAEVGVPAVSAAPGDAREAVTPPSDPVSPAGATSPAAIGARGDERLRPAIPAGEPGDATRLADVAAAPARIPAALADPDPHDLSAPAVPAEARGGRPGDHVRAPEALAGRTRAATPVSWPEPAARASRPEAPGESGPSLASGSRAAGEHEPPAEPRASEVAFRPTRGRPVAGWPEPGSPRESGERGLTAHASGPVRDAPFETGAPLHTTATPAPVPRAGAEPSTAADLQAAASTGGSGRSTASLPPGPSAPTASSVAEHVLRGVLSLERPGRHRLELHLEPPDLGTVRVDAVVEGRRLVLALHAEREPVRLALESALGRLTEALTQQGLVPERITVSGGFGFWGGPGDDRASRRDPAAVPGRGPRHEPATVAAGAPEGRLDLRV